MSRMSCPQETAVWRAVRSGEWKDSLRAHAGSCGVCREVAQTSRWMWDLAQGAGASAIPPDAGGLWQRAQMSEALNEKRAETEAAHRAARWIEIASLALVFVGAVCWVVWNWRVIEAAMVWISPLAWMAAYDASRLAPVEFWSIVGVLSFVAIALAYPIVSTD